MKKFIRFLFFVLLIILLLLIYGRYVGTDGLITKEYNIRANIDESFNGLKIVHFSDLHYLRVTKCDKLKQVVEDINLINPDIVVFTGDLIDKDMNLTDKDYNDLTNTLLKINAKYGKYAVIGNHDYQKDKKSVTNILTESGFTYLENDYDILYNNDGEKIFIN